MPKRKRIAKDILMHSRGQMLVNLVTTGCNTPQQKEKSLFSLKTERTRNWLETNDFTIDAENLSGIKLRREENVSKKVDNIYDTVISLTVVDKLREEIDGAKQRDSVNDLNEKGQPTEENYEETIRDNIDDRSDKLNKTNVGKQINVVDDYGSEKGSKNIDNLVLSEVDKFNKKTSGNKHKKGTYRKIGSQNINEVLITTNNIKEKKEIDNVDIVPDNSGRISQYSCNGKEMNTINNVDIVSSRREKRNTNISTQLISLDIGNNETCHIFNSEEKSISEPSIDQCSSSSFVPSTPESDDSNTVEIKKQSPFAVRFSDDDESSVKPDLTQNINTDSNTDVAATTELQKKILSSIFLDNYVQQSENKKNKKKTICKFCRNNVTNFERHLERHHRMEKEVKELLNLPKTSKESKTARRNIIALLRFETQFEEFIEGAKVDDNKLPCAHCKRLVRPSYLRRHFKVCMVKPINATGQRIQHRAQSQTLLACAADFSNTEAALRVKNEVFSKMKADEIGLVAKKDALIRHYGENYLKKHKRAQITTACSNKLRECARLLIEIRRRTNNTVLTFFDMLSTIFFDLIVASSKTISGYEEGSKKFKAPSLAIHMGTTLKQVCDLCSHLILKGVFKCINIEEKLKDIKRLKHMIETQWNCEISSLAIKDLAENKWNKPVRLPLTKDVIKFRDYVIQISNENFDVLQYDKTNRKAFQILMETSLCLSILFNRRRIGDVQYLHVESYLKNFETMDQEEFSSVLTESEKVLTSTYKRVVAGGKGSRAITILFPKNLQKYIGLLLEVRRESDIVPKKNPYLFACPGKENHWIRADVVIRKLAHASGVENPQAISSNRLRKQIGTLMQIMNLSKEEYEQFAKFMGHTEKTHKEFYEITQDAYQTAKVSKLLALFDKGQGFEYKGKPLNEINIEPGTDTDEDVEDIEETAAVVSTSHEQLPSTSQELSEHSDKSDDKSTNRQCRDKKSKNVKKGNRVRWTQRQKSIVKQHFQQHIRKKIPPKKDECLEFIKKNKATLDNLDWVKVKTFVYNIYKNN